jgi:hypothetical protein
MHFCLKGANFMSFYIISSYLAMKNTFKSLFFVSVLLLSFIVKAQVKLESETKITDEVMYFDGERVSTSTTTNSTTGYDYVYGPALTPHGDCIKSYKDFVFMTWYRGGKEDRHVMLSRYNKVTGVLKTIEFPHQHTGFKGRWWIGETHNTIAIGICPKDETIHMVYDMHRNGTIASLANDYLRYSYSEANAATVADEEFTIDLFVQSPNNNYKHLSFPGINDDNTTKLLTYPAFMTNDEGDLFMKNRFGYDRNSKLLFAKYDGNDWEGYTDFNRSNATSFGNAYNWGIYGDIKYLNGKIRIGFHQRANIRNDRYLYQNGFYYAYSDDPSGLTQWKNHKGESFARPLVNSDLVKVSEPGDVVETNKVDQVNFNGFGWTVTDNDDVHLVGKVQDRENNVTKFVHTYKPGGTSEFITTTDFAGGSIYAAGSYVYLIGLNASGRPVIRRAEGGTNLFVKVYEQTSGKRFNKASLYISDGKLHYYLLENNSANNDDTRTTYLQIIDLDIQEGPKPFAVSLVTPTNNQSFNEGKNVQLFATATADEGEITKVAFMVNNELLEEDTTKPYLLDWTPKDIGSYQIKAVAYKTSGESITSSEISIEIKEIDESDLTIDTYRLQNVGTGKYLVAAATAQPITMSSSAEEADKHWEFFKLTHNDKEYHNIDSKQSGILRATGAGFAAGAYLVVSTTKSPGANDSDKIWTVHYNEVENTFRFEAGTSGRYMYHDADGNVYSKTVEATDTRSVWRAIPTSQVLSVSKEFLKTPSINIFPNPAKDGFTLGLNNIGKAEVKIFNVLGSVVYKTSVNKTSIEINKDNVFTSGIYLVKVIEENNKVHQLKLIIE